MGAPWILLTHHLLPQPRLNPAEETAVSAGGKAEFSKSLGLLSLREGRTKRGWGVGRQEQQHSHCPAQDAHSELHIEHQGLCVQLPGQRVYSSG